VYVIDPRVQIHSLTPYASIFVDSSEELSVIDLTDKQHAPMFTPLTGYKGGFQSGQNYWLRIPVTSLSSIDHWWFIIRPSIKEYDYYARIDRMKFYQLDTLGQIIDSQQSGVSIPKSQKKLQMAAGFTGADLSLPAHQAQFLFIQLSQDFNGEPFNINIELRNPSTGIPESQFSSLLFTLSGIAFVMGLLSLFFFLFIREKAYLYFFIYLLFLSLHYLILHPALPFTDKFIPWAPLLTSHFFVLFTMGGFIMFMMFGRHFINLPVLSPKTDYWLMMLLRVWGILVAVNILAMIFMKRTLTEGYSFLPVLISIGFIVRFAFFKNTLARFFVVGAGWLLIWTLTGMLFVERMLEIGINPWPIGQVGQMLIYLAGIAYKIRINEHEKAEAQRIREMDGIKSRFFANISHEFRTPLTLIRGLLQQITGNHAPSNGTIMVQPRQLQTMQRNADRLLELVNQLLDLSRLDSGKMKLQIIRGDILQILKTLSHAFDSMAERKQIHYHIHFPEQTPIAFFDKDKLEKIFTNLLSNAFKYTPEKGMVSVNVEMIGGRLRITVEDTGPGIAKKELDKVFDRFYQSEGNEDKGSGIGLALVKELVELYKGQISVSSEPGKGSQFRVSLPVERSAFSDQEMVFGEWHSKDEELIMNSDDGEASHVREAQKAQLPLLLVVEDNTDLRQFIRETMEQAFHVIEAPNGKDGFERAVNEVPDIIISDVMMPGIDGFTLTARLKKDERTSHIPVILLTAKAGQQHKVEGLETGADDYLTKPFEARELLVRSQNLIDQRKLLRQKFAGQLQIRPSEIVADSVDVHFLAKVMETIEQHMSSESFGVEELAQEIAMSRSQLHRKLVSLIGKSPSELLRQTRLIRAKELLQKKAGTPAEVAYQVGFNSHSYFSKCYKEEFGINPSEV
jgi:signal transduction histidine kinase/DNA-binding response OmpR family regulator